MKLRADDSTSHQATTIYQAMRDNSIDGDGRDNLTMRIPRRENSPVPPLTRAPGLTPVSPPALPR
jgi:hypothetical protein